MKFSSSVLLLFASLESQAVSSFITGPTLHKPLRSRPCSRPCREPTVASHSDREDVVAMTDLEVEDVVETLLVEDRITIAIDKMGYSIAEIFENNRDLFIDEHNESIKTGERLAEVFEQMVQDMEEAKLKRTKEESEAQIRKQRLIESRAKHRFARQKFTLFVNSLSEVCLADALPYYENDNSMVEAIDFMHEDLKGSGCKEIFGETAIIDVQEILDREYRRIQQIEVQEGADGKPDTSMALRSYLQHLNRLTSDDGTSPTSKASKRSRKDAEKSVYSIASEKKYMEEELASLSTEDLILPNMGSGKRKNAVPLNLGGSRLFTVSVQQANAPSEGKGLKRFDLSEKLRYSASAVVPGLDDTSQTTGDSELDRVDLTNNTALSSDNDELEEEYAESTKENDLDDMIVQEGEVEEANENPTGEYDQWSYDQVKSPDMDMTGQPMYYQDPNENYASEYDQWGYDQVESIDMDMTGQPIYHQDPSGSSGLYNDPPPSYDSTVDPTNHLYSSVDPMNHQRDLTSSLTPAFTAVPIAPESPSSVQVPPQDPYDRVDNYAAAPNSWETSPKQQQTRVQGTLSDSSQYLVGLERRSTRSTRSKTNVPWGLQDDNSQERRATLSYQRGGAYYEGVYSDDQSYAGSSPEESQKYDDENAIPTTRDISEFEHELPTTAAYINPNLLDPKIKYPRYNYRQSSLENGGSRLFGNSDMESFDC